MSIQVLNVRTARGNYRVKTASGAVYLLELLPGETNVVSVQGGSRNLEKSLFVLPEGIVAIGEQMTLEPSLAALLGGRGVTTSSVISIEPVSP